MAGKWGRLGASAAHHRHAPSLGNESRDRTVDFNCVRFTRPEITAERHVELVRPVYLRAHDLLARRRLQVVDCDGDGAARTMLLVSVELHAGARVLTMSSGTARVGSGDGCGSVLETVSSGLLVVVGDGIEVAMASAGRLVVVGCAVGVTTVESSLHAIADISSAPITTSAAMFMAIRSVRRSCGILPATFELSITHPGVGVTTQACVSLVHFSRSWLAVATAGKRRAQLAAQLARKILDVRGVDIEVRFGSHVHLDAQPELEGPGNECGPEAHRLR